MLRNWSLVSLWIFWGNSPEKLLPDTERLARLGSWVITGEREPEMLELDISRETIDLFKTSHWIPVQEQRDKEFDTFQLPRGVEDSNSCFREARIDACFLRDRLCEDTRREEQRKNKMREKRKRNFISEETIGTYDVKRDGPGDPNPFIQIEQKQWAFGRILLIELSEAYEYGEKDSESKGKVPR